MVSHERCKSSYLAASAVIGSSVSIVIASECARTVGMRTAVHDTLISASVSPKIFTVSQATFISSFVYPFDCAIKK